MSMNTTPETFPLTNESEADAALSGTPVAVLEGTPEAKGKKTKNPTLKATPKGPTAAESLAKQRAKDKEAKKSTTPVKTANTPSKKGKNVTTATKTAPKKATTKKGKKPAKANGKEKSVPKSRTDKDGNLSPWVVAGHSDRFNTDQVKMLRCLATHKGKIPATRAEVKVGCGMAVEDLYSAKWLENLWALHNKKLIKIEDSAKYTDQIRNQHVHTITDAGREALKKTETEAKEKEKARNAE